jgi:Cu-Zn family superoxide dismutase
MVHAKPDDMKTDPTGNAGDRIACGVITSTAGTLSAAGSQ